MTNVTSLITIIFKNQLILGFVYHVVVHIIPFGNLRAKDFSSWILKTTLKSPIKTILSPEQNIENVVNSRYLYIDQILSLSFSKKESLFFAHINVCSLNKNFDDLVYLLKRTSKSFDIILVSETRISKTLKWLFF